MTRLEKRNGSQDNLVLEKRYIRTVLREEGQDILREQTRTMSRASFSNRELFSKRKMDVTNTILSYEHLARHRFIDMKRRRTQKGVINKKNYPIHNRILFGYLNNIIKRLHFGFTDSTREIMRHIED
mgnify:CR=1 FL=1